MQKSGYFARSAAANREDLTLIKAMVKHAVESGLKGESGVVGHDEGRNDILRTIEFPRIKGGKAFDTEAKWFTRLLKELEQPKGKPVTLGNDH